jgi:hypothetical protein
MSTVTARQIDALKTRQQNIQQPTRYLLDVARILKAKENISTSFVECFE